MLIFALFLGCDTVEMSQAWQIDRLRVLAVAADPAEPRPGDVVTYDALVVSPAKPLLGSAWFVCDAGSSTDFGCDIDPSLFDGLDSGEVDIAALAAAGMIGFLPSYTPTWTVPTDYLDALPAEDQIEGTFAMTYITAIPEVADGEEMQEDDLEIAYKRVPVSLSTTPNHNPHVASWSIDDVVIEDGAEVRLDPGQAYTIGVELSDDSVETYTFHNEDGEDESRTEEPYFSWYLQEGDFNQSNTLWPYAEAVYFAPDEPTLTQQSLWVVVRDRRGGMAWSELKLRFAD